MRTLLHRSANDARRGGIPMFETHLDNGAIRYSWNGHTFSTSTMQCEHCRASYLDGMKVKCARTAQAADELLRDLLKRAQKNPKWAGQGTMFMINALGMPNNMPLAEAFYHLAPYVVQWEASAEGRKILSAPDFDKILRDKRANKENAEQLAAAAAQDAHERRFSDQFAAIFGQPTPHEHTIHDRCVATKIVRTS